MEKLVLDNLGNKEKGAVVYNSVWLGISSDGPESYKILLKKLGKDIKDVKGSNLFEVMMGLMFIATLELQNHFNSKDLNEIFEATAEAFAKHMKGTVNQAKDFGDDKLTGYFFARIKEYQDAFFSTKDNKERFVQFSHKFYTYITREQKPTQAQIEHVIDFVFIYMDGLKAALNTCN